MANKELAKRSTMDKLAAVVGAGAGAVAGAGTLAGGGLLGSIGGVFGLTIVAATPVGWLLGGAALGAAALYGGSKMVGGKGYSDGDTNASKQFNSDNEKKLYMQLTTKLSQKDSIVAKELLSKLSDEYKDFAKYMNDGLTKGSASATEIITMCCELLNEDVNTYLDGDDFSPDDIELTIKIATLMALADGEYSEEEATVIYAKVVEFFELDKILDESEIDLIFSQAQGSEEQQLQLANMTYEEIQSIFVVFFLVINNDRLKDMLLDFLAAIAEADGEISDKEEHLYGIFLGLLNAEKELDNYFIHLEKLTKTKSDMLYSHQGRDCEGYSKKAKNALSAYAKGIPTSSIISLYDSTVFGKADNGFIVTPLAIITDQAEAVRVIPFGSIFQVDLSEDGSLIFYGEADENNNMYPIAELDCMSEEISPFLTFLENIVDINNSSTESIEEEIDNILDDKSEWHLAQDGNQLGIHSLQEIDEKMENKELLENNLLVWKDGMTEWLPATEIEEINSIIEQGTVTNSVSIR
jgi:hypothetical protein